MRNILSLGSFLMIILSSCTPQPVGDNIIPRQEGKDYASEISVSDQQIEQNIIVIDAVVFDKPGYIVIHAVVDGKPGPVLGSSEIYLEGVYSTVGVRVSDYESEKERIAMLHYDDGDNLYEFPGDDVPAKKGDDIVMAQFSLIG